tara:strand:+ start:3212 stop:3550 length:339 start_codon:yes stop_codon:yes gene_type:complete
MISSDPNRILIFLNSVDPGPLFVISLLPYIVFLYYAQKTLSIPKISLLGFRLTLLFVIMTIIFAVISLYIFNEELTNVDPLHGAAEVFLTLSDALILLGFSKIYQEIHVKNS